MKITGFHPVIMSAKADSIISMFEELGFEKRHFTTFNDQDSASVYMKDANGFVVDVSQVDTLPHENRDLMSIRINIDDFDEALAFLTDRGFTNPLGDAGITTNSSKGVLLLSPTGFLINLVQHIRN
jgi:hypothetical protein